MTIVFFIYGYVFAEGLRIALVYDDLNGWIISIMMCVLFLRQIILRLNDLEQYRE